MRSAASLAVVFTIAMLPAAAAQSPANGDNARFDDARFDTAPSAVRSASQQEVNAVVERFFQGMLEQDADMLRSTVAPNAVLLGTATRDGQTTIRSTPLEQFIASVTQRQGEPANERIFNPRVEIDGDLAHVWTFYTLHIGERFSHCGYDSFQLLRTTDGWKIVSVADTRRTENCEPPG